MTKKTFLTKLRDKLSILETNEIDDIIEEYSSHIVNKIEQGKTEKEAVADFGDIDELANEILSAYKIKGGYKKEEVGKFEQFITELIENIVNFFKKLFDDVSEQKTSKILVTILYIIIGLLLFGMLLWFIRIPFELAEAIGLGIINIGNDNILTRGFGAIWSTFIGISCLIVTVIITVALIKKALKYFEENDSEIKFNEKYIKEKSEIAKEEIKAGVINIKEEFNHTKNEQIVLDFLTVFVKIFVVIFVFIPLIGTNIGLAITLGAVIFFLIQGIISVGMTLIVLGMLIISGALTLLITKFLFGKGGVK